MYAIFYVCHVNPSMHNIYNICINVIITVLMVKLMLLFASLNYSCEMNYLCVCVCVFSKGCFFHMRDARKHEMNLLGR